MKEQNKKRTPTLAGKVVLYILILTLSIVSFYGFNKIEAERNEIQKEISELSHDIQELKARQFELEAMLNHAEFINPEEPETSSIQK
ncbi:MAG: hypothetical protein RR565_04875 [Erysipelothrix sp.]